jgi:hypothetical protein
MPSEAKKITLLALGSSEDELATADPLDGPADVEPVAAATGNAEHRMASTNTIGNTRRNLFLNMNNSFFETVFYLNLGRIVSQLADRPGAEG